MSDVHLAAGAIQTPRDPPSPISATGAAIGGQRRSRAGAAPLTRPIDESRSPEAGSRQNDGGRGVFWWTALAAIVLLAVAAVAIVLHVYAPLDRSTPSATVTGYFNALSAQDYTRAWHYTAGSADDPTSQASFLQNQRADDALSGRVLSMRVISSQEDSSSHETVMISVTRSGSPQSTIHETVLVTQYGGNWLIDSITPG